MADSEASPVAAPPRAPSPAASAAGAGAAALRGRSYAVVEAAAVAPAPHQAPPPARTTALRGHLAWVADVVLLAYCAASWVNLAAIGVAIAARRVCGDDSRAAAAAKKAAETAFIVMAMLIPVASPRFVWIVERCRKVEDRQRQLGSGATRRADVQRDRPASSGPGARTCPNARLTSASVAMLVALVCTLVMLVGQLIQVHAPAKDSYQDKFGSAISDMACLIATLVLCSFLLPGTVIQLLRHGCGVGYGPWQLNA